MSAEILREAAALMRERAEAATVGPWEAVEGASGHWWVECPHTADIALDLHGENAQHIASWHPTVALAVAAWLDAEADFADDPKNHAEPLPASLATARAYLGRDA